MIELIFIYLFIWFVNYGNICNLLCRAPIFSEDLLGGETGEGEALQSPERSFWAKYVSNKE